MTNSLSDRAAKGALYGEMLRSGEVTDALDGVEAQLTEELLNCRAENERNNLWHAVQVCRKVRQLFGQIAGDGLLATNQLQELRKLR